MLRNLLYLSFFLLVSCGEIPFVKKKDKPNSPGSSTVNPARIPAGWNGLDDYQGGNWYVE